MIWSIFTIADSGPLSSRVFHHRSECHQRKLGEWKWQKQTWSWDTKFNCGRNFTPFRSRYLKWNIFAGLNRRQWIRGIEMYYAGHVYISLSNAGRSLFWWIPSFISNIYSGTFTSMSYTMVHCHAARRYCDIYSRGLRKKVCRHEWNQIMTPKFFRQQVVNCHIRIGCARVDVDRCVYWALA